MVNPAGTRAYFTRSCCAGLRACRSSAFFECQRSRCSRLLPHMPPQWLGNFFPIDGGGAGSQTAQRQRPLCSRRTVRRHARRQHRFDVLSDLAGDERTTVPALGQRPWYRTISAGRHDELVGADHLWGTDGLCRNPPHYRSRRKPSRSKPVVKVIGRGFVCRMAAMAVSRITPGQKRADGDIGALCNHRVLKHCRDLVIAG